MAIGSMKVKKKKKKLCQYIILLIPEKSEKINFLTKVEKYLEIFGRQFSEGEGGEGAGLAGPDRPNWNLAKFWGGGRGTAVLTDWRVVMVRLARRDGGWQCESEKKKKIVCLYQIL